MDSYYYSFEPTGNEAIDRILCAVAAAGRGYQSTLYWSDPDASGKSYVDRIQDAANAAAVETGKPAAGTWAWACETRELCFFADRLSRRFGEHEWLAWAPTRDDAEATNWELTE